MGMETMGNSGIVAGGMGAGVQPMIDLGGYRHNDCDNGFGGNGIWAILLLALLGRRGFGEGCGDGGNGYAANALPVITNENFNQRFGSLQDTVNWTGLQNTLATYHQGQLEATRDAADQICTTRETVLTGFGNTRTELAQGFGAVALQGCQQTGTLSTNILENRYQNALGQATTDRAILESRYQALLGKADTDAKLAECCCESKMLAMENTCAIMKNDDANTQKVLDKLNCMEITNLRDKLSERELELSQCRQNAYLVNAIRPTPVPSYPVYANAPIFNPVVSASSFCGAPGTTMGGCGCGL